jgi:hypothetical protein
MPRRPAVTVIALAATADEMDVEHVVLHRLRKEPVE